MNSSQAVSHGFPITNLQTGSSWKSNRGFKRVLDTELLQTGAVKWLLNLPGWLPAHLPLSSTLKSDLDDSAWFVFFIVKSSPPTTDTNPETSQTVGVNHHLIDLRRRELRYCEASSGPMGPKLRLPKTTAERRTRLDHFYFWNGDRSYWRT